MIKIWTQTGPNTRQTDAPGVAHVAVVVHRGAAHVPQHAVPFFRDEALLLARERVEDAQGVEPVGGKGCVCDGVGGLSEIHTCIDINQNKNQKNIIK